ncbi:MAG TPA: 4-(cytidine 5'-diphospho)-2-C-methyl-D-erythritol kinase [Thermoleophilaceae bacterium]|jgi:4-diphosphocytidyl-2-C-methyl-D-erythritol kinase|nr:4-(cytidine 5'-diphospho)-2-C-methyl-D-erythritol kinase [Thermoleophilaceae bacterium]
MIRERAPAKVNLVLQVGARRADGLHEICSIFASLKLEDELTFLASEDGDDNVRCPGVEGPNLVDAALKLFRERVDSGLPGLDVSVEKRIPVAAGLGGGSADAAAALRAANELAGRPLDTADLRALSAELGADVPSQIEPRHALVTGAGEYVEALKLPAMGLVLVPNETGLSTADVYREADRLGSTREGLGRDRLRELAEGPLPALAAGVENDLEPAALSLRPDIGGAIDALRAAGALAAGVSGSGPTAFGVFSGPAMAERAAAAVEGAIATRLKPS